MIALLLLLAQVSFAQTETLDARAQTGYADQGNSHTAGKAVRPIVGTKDGLLGVATLGDITHNCYSATASSASYASTTDLFTLAGNASNTVLLHQIRITCTQTTAGQVTLSILKRSVADTSGTSSTINDVPLDANYSASTSNMLSWSAAPTRGALISSLDIASIGCMASATASPNDIYVSPSSWLTHPVVLRGTAQNVAVSLAAAGDGSGTTVSGGNFNVQMTWCEVTTP
jgi:hypothetical protein